MTKQEMQEMIDASVQTTVEKSVLKALEAAGITGIAKEEKAAESGTEAPVGSSAPETKAYRLPFRRAL